MIQTGKRWAFMGQEWGNVQAVWAVGHITVRGQRQRSECLCLGMDSTTPPFTAHN